MLILSLALGTLSGCGGTREEPILEAPAPARVDKRIRVIDVTNSTRELYDVDAIGMLWNGLNESLMKRGLLWMGEPSIPVLRLEASIVEYNKGNVLLRPLALPWGKTVLSVKCDLKEDGRIVATAESKRSVSVGDRTFTVGAWKKVFSEVAEDVVRQLSSKI